MTGSNKAKLKKFMLSNSFAKTFHGPAERLFIEGFMEKARGNYFVEAGACNGFHLSQTSKLEKVHGWNGLLVEGHAGLFELLKEGKRKATKAHAVLGPGGPVIFEQKTKGMLGQSRLQSDLISPDCIKTESKTLEQVLTEAKAPSVIDFLVLDVEESLPAVWSGVDFHRRHFDFMVIEMKEEQPEIIADIKARGYRLAGVINNEDFLFHK